MVQPRIPETDEGIQDSFDVHLYDSMQRRLRDRGWIDTPHIIASGIEDGHALEIGPGPGYLGLEWLKRTSDTQLTGLEISEEMIRVAEANAAEYGYPQRAAYVLGNARRMPFDDGSFDGAFSNGSLHEWTNPAAVLAEMYRVLKPGGRYFVTDLKRDMGLLVRVFLHLAVRPSEMRAGLKTSLQAAYTRTELDAIVASTPLASPKIATSPMGLIISGQKPA